MSKLTDDNDAARGGRPRLDDREKRWNKTVCVSDGESSAIERAARQCGKPMSTFIRDAALEKAATVNRK